MQEEWGMCLQVPQASPEALNLIAWCCQWDPAKRPTALEALQHPFFQVCLAHHHACAGS